MNRQHPSQSTALADHEHARTLPNAVDTAAIQDGAVTTAKIADGTILSTDLNASAYGTVGQITAIDPDDTAAAGATAKIADAGHQHAIVAGTPAALTRTATSAESAGSGFARDVHVHATDQMAWGLLAAPTALTANSSNTSGTTDLDLALDQTITVAANRYVKVSFDYRNIETSSGLAVIAAVKLRMDGTVIKEQLTLPTDATNSGGDGCHISRVLNPSAASHTFDVVLQKVAGGADIHIVAASTYPAQLVVEDVGPV